MFILSIPFVHCGMRNLHYILEYRCAQQEVRLSHKNQTMLQIIKKCLHIKTPQVGSLAKMPLYKFAVFTHFVLNLVRVS